MSVLFDLALEYGLKIESDFGHNFSLKTLFEISVLKSLSGSYLYLKAHLTIL